jgi:hypothetical protein
LLLCLVGATWNLAFDTVLQMTKGGQPLPAALTIDSFTATIGTVFLLLAAREVAMVTRVACEGGWLVVHGGLMSPWLRFSVPVFDGIEVKVIQDTDSGTHEVWLSSPTKQDLKLPVNLEGPPIYWNGGPRRVFRAPVSHASFVAERVTEMLALARRGVHRGGTPPD